MAREAGIGDLRHRVTVERLVQRDDGAGGQVDEWVAVSGAWCKVNAVSGRETPVAGIVGQVVRYRLETHFRTDISAGDRLAATWLPARHRIALDEVSDRDGLRRRIVMYGDASFAPDLGDPV